MDHVLSIKKMEVDDPTHKATTLKWRYYAKLHDWRKSNNYCVKATIIA
jgi:hypothetical protein